MNNKVEKFKALTTEMADTYERKNADYGDSYGESLNEFGIIAGVVRMGDKFNRLKSLSKHQRRRVKDESLRDTLLDLANYAIMSVMWLEEQPKKESAKACCANCSYSYTHCENGVTDIRCISNQFVNISQSEAETNSGCMMYEAR